jgi:hypothetical protein
VATTVSASLTTTHQCRTSPQDVPTDCMTPVSRDARASGTMTAQVTVFVAM